MNVQDIVTRVQSELEEATGSSGTDWTDADYIIGKLVTIGDDISVRLQLLDLNYSTQEAILPNVPANTTDLSAFQAANQPLAQMLLPKSVEWRLVGQNQEQWKPVTLVDKVIDTDTGTGEVGVAVVSDDAGMESYEWRGGLIKISPCRVPVDLRIRFVGTAISLNTNSQQQIIGLTNVYVYKCCYKIMAARSAGSGSLPAFFKGEYDRACADFEGLSEKTKQAGLMRLGGRRSGSPNGSGGGWRSPIVG